MAPMWVPRNPRRAMVVVTLVVAAISPVFTSLGAPDQAGRAPLVPVILGACLAALQLRHSFSAAAGKRPSRGPWTLAAMIVLVYAPLPWYTWNWLATQGLLTASALMVPRDRRVAIVAAALPALGTVLFFAVAYLWIGRPGWTVGAAIWEMTWWGVGIPISGAVVYGAARLVRAADELQAAHTELAELAIARERLRICRDLHDLIGQSLSAVSLRGDLALRLLPTDPAAAGTEIATLIDTARVTLHDVLSVTGDDPGADLHTEAEGAKALLAAAGIDAHISLESAGLPPDAKAVFAWALREGITNALRHSEAATCSITGSHADGRARLEIINDGARPAPARPGNGLAGLAERARAFSGELTAGPAPGATFRLIMELPVEEL